MTSADEFVRQFHVDLTRWFSGQGNQELVWQALCDSAHADMELVYPSGTKLSGAAFLQSIAELFGKSPGFTAQAIDVKVVHSDATHAVVSYIEEQHGARSSDTQNRRSALAFLLQSNSSWVWRFIQETAIQ